MDYEALGKRVRYERAARKWTQARLAHETNLSVSFLGHIERGSRKASLETLVALSNVLQVSPDFLLADSLARSSRVDAYDPLNPRQRQALRDIVRQISKNLDDWAEE